VTKFNQSKFSSRPASDVYRDNYDQIFPKKKKCRQRKKLSCANAEFHREAVAKRLGK